MIELWSVSTSLVVLIIIGILIIITIYGTTSLFDIQSIKDDWENQRCSPMIMPFASLFGYNTKENFDFCMKHIFESHSQPFSSSIGTMFSNFTALLQSIFTSVNSLRNTLSTLGGGINNVFQEFTNRIVQFFFKLRMGSIHLKSVFLRMYAILFSVMYMGLSGISGISSFTNTFLFSFLNTFCFPGKTKIYVKEKGLVSIKDIKIGDILLPGNTEVSATFELYAKGQPMVQLGSIIVSTNHYIMYKTLPIKAGNHPNAIKIDNWNTDEPLYCLNTTTHKIPVKHLTFLNYDETREGDKDTMNMVDSIVNGRPMKTEYPFRQYAFGLSKIKIKMMDGIKSVDNIKIHDKLNNGSTVVGLIKRKVTEICKINDMIITPSTQYWDSTTNMWKRIGQVYKIYNETCILYSFIVIPSSQIELENGMIVRDDMEICSPDSESCYAYHIENGYKD